MANYFLNDDGSLSKNKKKKKGNNYILDSNGNLTLNSTKEELTKKESNKRTWFNTSSFDDGYDFGDVTKSLLGTAQDITENLHSGAMGIGEKVIDLGAYAVGGIGGALGNKKIQSSMDEFIKKDLIDEEKVSKYTSWFGNPTALINRIVTGGKTEETSLLGEKSDSLVQSAGQLGATAGLQALGVPWWLTTGATSFGGGTEEALKSGASYGEAGAYGLISAGAEILTEKLSGGISFGGKTLDSGLKKVIGEKITNKTLNTLTKFGLDAVGEGGEEVLTEVITNVGKKLTYEDEKTWNELLTSEEAMDNYLESFIGGMVLGGGANTIKVSQSIKTGRDYDTGYTQNEQSVIDKETSKRTTELQKQKAVENRINDIINEREKTFGSLDESKKKIIRENVLEQLEKGEIDYNSTELSKKELSNIQKEVELDLKEGNLDIDTIESTLSSEKVAQIKELSEKLGKTTNEQQKAEIQAKINELTDAKNNEIRSMLGKDQYLQNSYREANLKNKSFEYEINENDSEYKKTLAEEFKNKANNTTKSHKTFEMLSKLSEDRQTQYHITNDTELKSLGYEVEGKSINGLVRVDKDGSKRILVNIDSNKALNSIVGHETTHLLEGTKEYKEFQEYMKKYAQTKGEYDTRYKQISNLYNGVEADIDSEVTADLVGDYLFTDSDFVNQLSVEKPSIFQKIYNEIKHLYKMATAGSQEARELERVKKAFEKAYRQNAVSKNAGTKYSLESDSRDYAKEIAKSFKGKNEVSLNEIMEKANEYAFGELDTEYNYTQQDNIVDEEFADNIIEKVKFELDKMGYHLNEDTDMFTKTNEVNNVDNTNPTDNPDINLSLSNQNDIAPKNPNLTYGEDIKLQVEEAIAPLQEEIAELKETLQDIKIEDKYAPITEEDLPMFEQQLSEAPLNQDAPVEVEEYDYYPRDTISMDSKALTTLSKNIRKELGLNKVQTTELESIIQEFSTSETATKEDLFNAIKDRFSEKNIKYKNEEIASLKSFLRNYPLYVSDYIKTEFRDGFNKVRQRNFGKLKFNNDGTPIDVAYEELSSMYPAYFPSDINNAQDQLQQIIDVANYETMEVEKMIIPDEIMREMADFIYDSVQDYKLDELYKSSVEASRIPYDESLIPVQVKEEVTPVKEVSNTEVVKENVPVEENKNLTIKESNALKLKNLEAQLEKNRLDAQNSFNSFKELIAEKNKQYDSLKNKDTLKANSILQQVNRLVAQRDNIQVEYERKMNRLQERIDKMGSKEFKRAEQRQTKMQEYRERARNLIGDTSTWVDKKLGIQYQINTLKRNLRDIVRGVDGKQDILTADAIYEEYQGKYNKNEAKLKVEYNKLVNPYMEMKLTNQEHIYTQMLGEFKYNPDTTLTQEYLDDYYNKHKNKIDVDKVNKAIESARQTYDSLFNRINEALRNQGMKELEYRRGYFPHFVEDKQSFIAKLFDWKVKNDQIPTDIAGLTELNNPERSWQSFNKHRESDITDYNFGKGLETYVRGALDWIYHIEDIQKRRALENEIRYQHSEDGVKERIEAIYNNTELDADEVQAQIEAVYGVANNPLNNFVTDLRNSTNNLAGKKSTMDRGVEYATNRKIYSTMTNLSNRVSGNMIGGSISSALTNFIPITQSWVEVNPTSSLGAMLETIKSSIKDDGTIAKSTFLTNRLVKNENLYKTGWDKAADKVAIMTDIIDSFTAQTIWRSKYNENIKKGMSEMEAIADADRFAENVMAGRSRGNEPTIFNSKNPFIKMLTSFQLEVNNQYQYMFKDAPVDIGSKGKLIKGYTTAFIGAYVYNALYSSLVGRDAAFDPIGLIEDVLKELGIGGDDDEEEKSASEKFTSITEDFLQQLPFVGGLFGGGRVPISAAIPYENPIAMITGTGEDALKLLDGDKREKALKDLTTEWLKPVTYLALPFGGGQINKTVQGLSMYDEDLPVAGSYTNGGDLRFTADESLGGKIKSALFGRWASESAQDYVDSGFKTVKKSNIEEMLELGMNSTEYRKYRNGLNRAGDKNSDKLDYINDLDVPIEHKNIMANNVLDRDYEVDMSNYTTYEEFDYSVRYPEKYNVITKIDSFDNYKSYEEEIKNIKEQYKSTDDMTSKQKTALSKQRKAAIQSYINSLNLGIPQKIMLEKMAGGYSIKEQEGYMYSYIESLPISAEEKQKLHDQLFK